MEELDGLMVGVLDVRSCSLGLNSAQALTKTIRSPSHQPGVHIDSRDFKIWYS